MVRIVFNGEYFNVEDTLCCGQIFRFYPYKQGYTVISQDKCAYVYNQDKNAVIECEDSDKDYFYNFFDLKRDYSAIYQSALKEGDILADSATLGKGIRILNQDKTEMLISFIISQNNNIPRIKKIIEKICLELGEKKKFLDFEYYAFPAISQFLIRNIDFYYSVGLGYRAPYLKQLSVAINEGLDIAKYDTLSTEELKNALLKIYGVGPKVADCVSLFGYHRADSFPVDTWIEKVYKENFNGQLTDRKKIAEYFTARFKDNAGYYQQYLFYYKRSLEKNR